MAETPPLREYQSAAVEEVRTREWAGSRRILFVAPTGSGKTNCLTDLLLDPARSLVLTHRRVLLEQTARVLERHGVRYDMCASGYKYTDNAMVTLAMTQTLAARYIKKNRKLPEADRILIDEAHVQKADMMTAILDRYPGATVIGFTATPSDLGHIFDEEIVAATVSGLIEQGYLCQPRVFSCGAPDLELLEKMRRDSTGEYLAADVNKVVKPEVIFGRVLEHYKRLNPDGRPFVLFAHSVASSRWWAQMLSARDVPTAHISGDDVWVDGQSFKSDAAKRAECFKRIEDGSLLGLSNRFVLREGWDCPSVGHAILTAPVGTRKTFVQMCGRVLRPWPGREYSIIQDHSGSCIKHPALDSDEPWDWRLPAGVAEKARVLAMREDREPEPIVCPKCHGVRNAGPVCPFCGFQYAKHARFVIESDGTLKLVEGKSFRPRRVRPRPDDAKIWERCYWQTVKNSNRTAEQAYTYFAMNNGWRWLPRNLPLMPKSDYAWFIPLKDVPTRDLYERVG